MLPSTNSSCTLRITGSKIGDFKSVYVEIAALSDGGKKLPKAMILSVNM